VLFRSKNLWMFLKNLCFGQKWKTHSKVDSFAKNDIFTNTKSEFWSKIEILLLGHQIYLFGGPEKGRFSLNYEASYCPREAVYFVTAFVPSETACFASSPGSKSRIAV